MNKEEIISRVEESIGKVRQYLIDDGGDLEIVEVTDDNVVKVKLLGACQSCPQSYMTMKAGVEQAVKKAMPFIKAVEAININE